MRSVRPAAAVLASCLLWASAGQAQDSVQVRGGDHDAYGRMVFDWSQPVRYRAFVAEGHLHLEFARKGTFTLSALHPALDAYIGEPAPGPHGYRLMFPLKGQFRLEHWTSGPKVVIDLKRLPDGSGGEPTVRLRVGRHKDFDRLVFDWPSPVGYEVSRDMPERASVRFRRPAQFNLARYAAAPPPRVTSVEPMEMEGGGGVAVGIPADARLRHFSDGAKVVVDVVAPLPAAGGAAAGAAQAPDSGRVSTPTPPSPPKALSKAADGGPARRPAPREGEAGEPLHLVPAARAAMARDQAARGTDDAADAGKPAMLDEGSMNEDAVDDGGSNADSATAVSPPASVAPGRGRSGVGWPDERFPPQRVARGIAPQPGQAPPQLAAGVIDAPWAAAGGAVFRRSGALWFIAAGAAPAGFAGLLSDASAAVSGASVQQLRGATAIRLDASAGVQAWPHFGAGHWRLSLGDRPALPDRPLEVRVRDGEVVLPVEGAGPVLTLDDPGDGGRLVVVPLTSPGGGLVARHDFPEFTLLATALGVAVVPKAEHVQVRAEASGVVIGGAGRPLAVSRAGRGRGGEWMAAGRGSGRRLLDLDTWRREQQPYSRARQELQKAIVEASSARRPLARLRLARFYFAHGLAQEALGALGVYAKDAPRRALDPQVRLMSGAAHLLAGNWRQAGEALVDPALDGVQDALPWRAAYAAVTGADHAAVAAFHRAEPLLRSYPDTVRKRMQLWIAGARLRLGDTDTAERNLAAARDLSPNRAEQAEIDFLTARKLLIEGEVDAAEALWRQVADGPHPSTRARARLVMVERDLAARRIDRAEAIARLERLRFAWRGDAFEGVLLHRLADFYTAGDDYRRALKALRQVAVHLPETAWAGRATERMRGIFKDLFLDQKADRLPALKALALYESFRELTPAGPDGDAMIARLVDRLVRVDLLERAADLLDGQIRHRLEGVARARAGARLASIYLLDRKPEKALDALDRSVVVGGEKTLTDRRRHLGARALAKLGRAESALALLRGDTSVDGLRLQADIHAKAGDWARAASALRALLPPAPAKDGGLDNGQARRVLRAVVAMTLAGQERGLDELDARYGSAMAATRHAETFRMLAGHTGGRNGVHTIAQRLAQVDHAKAFMNSFHDSLRQQASLADDR